MISFPPPSRLKKSTTTVKPNLHQIRSDFPILSQKVYGKDIVYFDNAATTQKPKQVIEAILNFYSNTNSNIHRGVHYLSEKSTEAYENARKTVQAYIGAKHLHEIVFTAGTTAGINAVAFSFGERFVKADDEILITHMEHHANIVPWQMLAERKGAKLKVAPINQNGELILDELEKLFTPKTKILAISQVSNSLGTVNPIKEIIQIAHDKGIPVLVDGAQAIQHGKVDVQDLNADFYVFSGHKIYGPTGIGVLYGKEKWLEQMPPYQGGGDMIKHVTFEKTTYNELPFKFEAGTINYVGAVGLDAAIEYVESIGLEFIESYEKELLTYATEKLLRIDGLRIFGTAKNKIAVTSFLLEGIHQFDVGMVLDKMGIAVRTGTHCTEPIMTFFGIDGTVRPSYAFYNTFEEIDQLAEALVKIKVMFG
ncbi:MAG: cysteine desulfurase [Bacteroidales bacterium]|nr:cysteine desulfurase [Bacteroidales bacterium]MCF8457128.1 cysteine desulfurase [Bacteroidales bacterium]